ncbi:MAG: aspartate aminotransferase family protein [Thermoplasmatota archaeon]
MKRKKIMEMEDRYQLQTYKKFPMALVEGKGIKVWDSEGNEYVDLYGGHAVSILGHCHPELVKSINEQCKKLIFYSNAVYNDSRARAGKKMIEVAPRGLKKVFFCNSGSEANETALKIARKYTGKTDIISMKEGFHGRTMGSLSVTGIDKYRTQFQPSLDGTKLAEFGDMDSIKKLADEKTAAVILEPIQSMAGMRTASTEFFRELKEYCEEQEILLIFDEVQTAFGRTGKMFAAQYYELTPDIISCAKSIAGGFPMGATIVNERIADTISYGEHGSTFGGGPIACAAAETNIRIISNLLETVEKTGDYLENKLDLLGGVKKVRGVGLLRGLKLETGAKDVQMKLLDNGFIVGTAVSESDVIRLMPPLVIGREHINVFYTSLEQIFQETK